MIRSLRNRLQISISLSCMAGLLTACAAFPVLKTESTKAAPDLSVGTAGVGAKTAALQSPQGAYLNIPAANSGPVRPPPPPATPAEIAALISDTPIDASLPPQPLPQFLDTVFGDLLHVPYLLGPDVGGRKEVITLRSSPHMSQRAFFELVQTALKDYGLVVSIQNGSVVVRQNAGASADENLVLRGRSSSEIPDSSRNVVQFLQLYTLDANTLQPLLTDLFPLTKSVKITPVVSSNALIISGSGHSVADAVSTITQLDQPRFAGARVARLEPVFFSAEAFTTALSNALTAEGYIVSNLPIIGRGVMILPLKETNQVLAFAGDDKVMSRIEFWATELDKPSHVGDQSSTFVYTVRNTDATTVGALVRGESPQTYAPKTPVGVPGASSTSSSLSSTTQTPAAVAPTARFDTVGTSGKLPGGGSIVVDPVGNRILFTGTATQFAELRSLLEQLDVAPQQVLIEVTVAEVTLTDETQIGLDWFFSHSQGTQALSGGTNTTAGSGLTLGSSGLNLTYSNTGIPGIGNLQAQFNAYASNGRANILSRPRIVAKSGSDAQVQVGTDIPIISSQAAAAATTAGTSDILQTVSYRQTGVILKIKPTIYGDRVNLEISQEISSAATSTTASIGSPSISDRTISTELSLQDGATAVLGGLISNEYDKTNEGIPYLKDIPIIGTAFRDDTINGTKSELVILVTPHVIHDTDEMSAVANGLSREINQSFKIGRGWSYTLSPFTGVSLGVDIPGRNLPKTQVGHDIDRVRRAKSNDFSDTDPSSTDSQDSGAAAQGQTTQPPKDGPPKDQAPTDRGPAPAAMDPPVSASPRDQN